MISQAVSVFVDADSSVSDPSKNVPKIIVELCIEPQQVKAGERFTLMISFRIPIFKDHQKHQGSFNVEESQRDR